MRSLWMVQAVLAESAMVNANSQRSRMQQCSFLPPQQVLRELFGTRGCVKPCAEAAA